MNTYDIEARGDHSSPGDVFDVIADRVHGTHSDATVTIGAGGWVEVNITGACRDNEDPQEIADELSAFLASVGVRNVEVDMWERFDY